MAWRDILSAFEVWITGVKAPDGVSSGTPFTISFQVWYLTLPFRKIHIFSRIFDEDGTLITEFDTPFVIYSPWGYIEYSDVELPAISKKSVFRIEAGYYPT